MVLCFLLAIILLCYRKNVACYHQFARISLTLGEIKCKKTVRAKEVIINQGTPGIFLVSTEGNAKSNECGEYE